MCPALAVQSVKSPQERLECETLPACFNDSEGRRMSLRLPICLITTHVNWTQHREEAPMLLQVEVQHDNDTIVSELR